MTVEYEFHVSVANVEERFAKRYDPKKVGVAKTDAQMEDASEQVSLGWFVTLAQFGVSFGFGKLKPEVEKGDTMIVSFRRIPKDPPKLAVAPVKPVAPADWIASLDPEVAARVAAALEPTS